MRSLLVVLLLLFASGAAHGNLIPHELLLHVQTVSSAGCSHAPQSFGCEVRPGDTIIGHFAVESDLLSRNGENLINPIYGFILQIGGVVWDQTRPACPLPSLCPSASDFLAFIGPDSVFPLARNAPAPGFDVYSGRITDLRGGIYGISDFPFVDFASWPGVGSSNVFHASDAAVHLFGTLSVRPGVVTEPSTLALLVLMFPVVATLARANQRRRTTGN